VRRVDDCRTRSRRPMSHKASEGVQPRPPIWMIRGSTHPSTCMAIMALLSQQSLYFLDAKTAMGNSIENSIATGSLESRSWRASELL
jgi:hypothetical protein